MGPVHFRPQNSTSKLMSSLSLSSIERKDDLVASDQSAEGICYPSTLNVKIFKVKSGDVVLESFSLSVRVSQIVH